MSTTEEGVKYDAGKPDWSLLPYRELEDVVRVLTYGAKKYPSPDNWKRVDNAKPRYLAAMMRHVTARIRGEMMDPETGLPHLAHAMCCLLFWMWHDKENSEIKEKA